MKPKDLRWLGWLNGAVAVGIGSYYLRGLQYAVQPFDAMPSSVRVLEAELLLFETITLVVCILYIRNHQNNALRWGLLMTGLLQIVAMVLAPLLLMARLSVL